MTMLENLLISLYHRLSTGDIGPIILLILLIVCISKKLDLNNGPIIQIRQRRKESKENANTPNT